MDYKIKRDADSRTETVAQVVLWGTLDDVRDVVSQTDVHWREASYRDLCRVF